MVIVTEAGLEPGCEWQLVEVGRRAGVKLRSTT
jgi:hypothetical protein